MCSRIIVSVSFCLINLGPIYGQFAEAEKDTLRINEYQPEKQKIKLNEATMRAIKSGTLINFDGPKQANKPRPFVSKIPITKDFGLKPVAGIPMEASDSIKIPPRVFHELTFNYLPEKEIRAFKVSNKLEELRATPAGFSFSAEDLLQSIFSKTARAKKRNLKKANAWKTYNSLP